ncbi:MAG TPA: flagellar biosynthesis protein FlhF [Ramlibacter sp.]|jgi:flagellar biosynthesis protein FlhF|uniref:flagellar biosynthesis protein FlhF n=1 Tax=Ramlibacter sp. TaxID=1917967 RepID=UPI002D5DC8AE|nr:flagellar biosynthesis protein FlhF [Ramlibacter sp.]HZY19138.1 flagellar biosynthesis protein FlhF [Ramlibacter sp.]
MNVKRFVGKNAREAMAQARAACGEDAVVLSNRPVPGGVEILAMAGTDVPALAAPARGAAPKAAPARRDDAAPMSTVSFQEFVRERQRQEALAAQAPARPAAAPARAAAAPAAAAAPRRAPTEPARFARQALADAIAEQAEPSLLDAPASTSASVVRTFEAVAEREASEQLMAELRTLRSSITQQLSGLAWFDNVRRSPAQTRLLRLLLGNGFSPVLTRRLVQRLPDDVADTQAEAWMLSMLSHNLRCAGDDAIQQRGGVFALVGPTGVGKTTTTAKIAANFALKHGAGTVGLITVDTYRMAASDQLRAFGRILNIPVHTARDSASLADLLDLFAGKKLVLIDTVGVGQRDRRLPELFAALPAGRIQRLLVLNAASQGETLDEVAQAYSNGPGTRCVISKLDEAARCGAVVDVALRHQLVIEGLANGQRVPEDWHAARPQLLAQKALMKPAASYVPDDAELGLLLTAPPAAATAGSTRRA